MRTLVVLALFALAACAEKGPLTQAYEQYNACLSSKPAAECQNERTKFEAAKAYADAVSNRTAAVNAGSQPLVLGAPAQAVYPQRQGFSCIQNGVVTTCY